MNKSLPPEWQAIADDIRSWYAKDATAIYQNAIEATVQRCYALASTDAPKLREKYFEECTPIVLRIAYDHWVQHGTPIKPCDSALVVFDAIRAAKKESK